MKITKRISLEKSDEQMLVFIKTLLEKKGMADLPVEILADMTLDLYGRLESYLFVSALNLLEADKYAEFDRLLEADESGAKALDFLKNNVADFKQELAKIMVDFENIYLAD